MMHFVILFVAVASIACGHSKNKPHGPAPQSTALAEKAALYSKLIKDHQDVSGYVDTEECNSLQRSGLVCTSGRGAIVSLEAAEDTLRPGRFYRRPTAYQECHASGASRSTISPDDLLGAWFCAYRTGNLAALERMWAYGSPRDWFMGDDKAGGLHTLLKPHQVATLASVIQKLGGKDHDERKRHPLGWGLCKGFECAIQIYEILLRGEADGFITAADKGALKYAAERQTKNPLAQYAWHHYSDGDQSLATELLLDDPRWPDDALPSPKTVCDAWSIQRDDNDKGMAPCPEEDRQHSGGDWLFVASRLISL